jgi:hypothetical protein
MLAIRLAYKPGFQLRLVIKRFTTLSIPTTSTEAQVTSFMLPNGPMMQVAGELLGFKNTSARAVGGTGYVSAGTGRSKCADVISLWSWTLRPLSIQDAMPI